MPFELFWVSGSLGKSAGRRTHTTGPRKQPRVAGLGSEPEGQNFPAQLLYELCSGDRARQVEPQEDRAVTDVLSVLGEAGAGHPRC